MAIISSVDLTAGYGDNLGMYILLVDHDPVVTATLAPAGSFIIRSSDKRMFRKVDDGSTTNVVPIIDTDFYRSTIASTRSTITITNGANVWNAPVGYSWTTPTLKGIYRVLWGVTLDRNSSGGGKGARLYNVTNSSAFGEEYWHSTGDDVLQSVKVESKLVEFLNETKTFRLELAVNTNNRSVGFKSFFVEVARVQKETA